MSTPLRALGAIAAVLAGFGIGCGATSSTSVQPSPVKCAVQVSPASASIGPAGGTGTVAVTSQPECGWSATADSTWISIVTPSSPQGSGQVQFQAASNSGPDRSGTFTVGDQKVTVNQAAGCTFSVQPSGLSIGSPGGPATVSVSTDPGCTWTAASQSPWVVLSSGAAGSGSGSVAFSVGSNAGVERSGTLLVAGKVVTMTQASGCTFTINPASQSFGIFGGNGSIDVTPSASGCAWTATTTSTWISFRSGNSGTTAGTVVYTVSPFVGGKRTGTIMVGGRTFTVQQN